MSTRANWCGLIRESVCVCAGHACRPKMKGVDLVAVSVFWRFGGIETQPPKSMQSENISVNLRKTESSVSIGRRRVDAASVAAGRGGSVKSLGSPAHAVPVPGMAGVAGSPRFTSSASGALAGLLGRRQNGLAPPPPPLGADPPDQWLKQHSPSLQVRGQSP